MIPHTRNGHGDVSYVFPLQRCLRACRGHNAHSGFLIIDARDLCSVIVRDIVHVVQDLIRITLRDYHVGKASVPAGRFPLVAERECMAFTSA